MKLVSFAFAALAFASLQAPGQEARIQRSALPPAVEKTVQAETKGATIKGFSTEREHGRKVYEAETIVDGHTRDLQIALNGTLNEVEEEVSLASLPTPVQAALKSKAGAATIKKVESLTKQGKLVAYEASTLNGTKHGEVQVGPAGETLKHEQ